MDAPADDSYSRIQDCITFSDYENPLVTENKVIKLIGLPGGTTQFRVRARSLKGNFSPFTVLDYEINDPYAGNIDRLQYGIPKDVYDLTLKQVYYMRQKTIQIVLPTQKEI